MAYPALPSYFGAQLPALAPAPPPIESAPTFADAPDPLQQLVGALTAPRLAQMPEPTSYRSGLAWPSPATPEAGALPGGPPPATGGMPNVSGRKDWIKLITRLAPKFGVDPAAALAVASVEGLSGAVGDSGTSFGPFQLHVGGALPKGRNQAWAESQAGIAYALRRMAAAGAKGLKGQAAIRAIVSNFERPADPTGEIQRAIRAWQTGPAPMLSNAASIIASAKTQLGVPYKWGGTAWGKALDCSGFVQQALLRNGISVGRTTYDQWKQGVPINSQQLQPGDVVFFNMGRRGPEHEGLYVGGGKFIEAPYTGANVRMSTLAGRKDFLGARRFA